LPAAFRLGETVAVPLPDDRATAGMTSVIPALPVRDVGAAVAHYRDGFGFEARYVANDFGILVRDHAILHLWAAADEDWRARGDLAERPVCTGAESFLAGTASCRIEVADVDGLFSELQRRGLLLDDKQTTAEVTDYGTREFAAVDLDGNLLTFFVREGNLTGNA
jgi:uncharacterized glyoxalase superfamily protein PhnB